MILTITGFMGAGKSTLAKELSSALNISYKDLDEEIEFGEHKPISKIFDEDGEKWFRSLEEKYLRQLILDSGILNTTHKPRTSNSPNTSQISNHSISQLQKSLGLQPFTSKTNLLKYIKQENIQYIISLGGGTLLSPSCKKIVHDNSICLFLDTPVETIITRLKDEPEERPLLRNYISHELTTRIKTLHESRLESYLSAADIIYR